jgi:hypothetical protein
MTAQIGVIALFSVAAIFIFCATHRENLAAAGYAALATALAGLLIASIAGAT